MKARNRYKVNIDSNYYVLLTDRSEEYVNKIVKYVNDKIEESKKNKGLDQEKQLILTLVNIADDLFSMKEEKDKFYEENKLRIDDYPNLKIKYEESIKKHNNFLDREVDYIRQLKNYEDEIKRLKKELRK